MFVSVCFMLAIGFVDWLDRGFVYIYKKFWNIHLLMIWVWLSWGDCVVDRTLKSNYYWLDFSLAKPRVSVCATVRERACLCVVVECVCVYTNALWSAKSCVANLLMLPVGKAVYSSDLAGLTGGYNQYRVNIPSSPPPPPPPPDCMSSSPISYSLLMST